MIFTAHNEPESQRKFHDLLALNSPFMQSLRQFIIDRLCGGKSLNELMKQDRLKNDEFDFDLTD
jgi:hypothetical protein